MSDMIVAKTILAQLGGNRFVRMTGARHLSAHSNDLSFRLPSGGFTRSGINFVRITLTPMDVYKVAFFKLGRAPRRDVTLISEHDDIYAEDLQKLFTRETGLQTSLGTMGASS